jgi:hypothetical protein
MGFLLGSGVCDDLGDEAEDGDFLNFFSDRITVEDVIGEISQGKALELFQSTFPIEMGV